MQFHYRPERVSKTKDPLLVIGLGGTGTDALINIKRKFKERFVLPIICGEIDDKPARTAYLAIDSDYGNLRHQESRQSDLRSSEVFELRLPNILSVVANPATMFDWEKSWWDTRFVNDGLNHSPGISRQAGRFMLFRNADSLAKRLTGVISNLLRPREEPDEKRLTILIASGVSGGTGSGIFLDVAYLLHYIMKKGFSGTPYQIKSYLFLPEVNLSRINRPSDTQQRLMKTNAFAALKELDFWMNWDRHQTVHKQQYALQIITHWDCAPFDEVVLMDGEYENETYIPNAYVTVMDTLSDFLQNCYKVESDADGNITYPLLPHLSSLQTAKMMMKKSFPVNYTYMSIGAANMDDYLSMALTYEGKILFDWLLALKDKPDIAGTPAAEEALKQVMPPPEDLFSLFGAIRPLPAYFNDEPGYTTNEIPQMHGEDALHVRPYQQFSREVVLDAKTFARERALLIWKRFEDIVNTYLTAPDYGPFVVSRWLRDEENGFLVKYREFINWWRSRQSDSEKIAEELNEHITSTLYPEMMNMNPFLKVFFLSTKFTSYISAAQQLYSIKRDALLAKAVAEELTLIEERFANYSNIILPAYCDLIEETSSSLNEEVAGYLLPENQTHRMTDFTQMKTYIDERMTDLIRNDYMDETVSRLIRHVADNSFNISPGENEAPGVGEERKTLFLETAEELVNHLARKINNNPEESLLDLSVPGTTAEEKLNFLNNTLFPDLNYQSMTMLKQLDPNTDEMFQFYLVSVPHNAKLVKQGLEGYQQRYRISICDTGINEHFHWQKINCFLPLYRFKDLRDMESIYESAIAENRDIGLHLVYSRNQDYSASFRHNWQNLPSPIPFVLARNENFPRPGRLGSQQYGMYQVIEEALRLQVARIEKDGLNDILVIHIWKFSDGSLEELETLKAKVDQIAEDMRYSDVEKCAKLNELMTESVSLRINCGNYTESLTRVLYLSLTPGIAVENPAQRVNDNLQIARFEAAACFMINQRPDIVEILVKQLEMYRYIYQQIRRFREPDDFFTHYLRNIQALTLLFIFDVIKWTRDKAEFRNASGELTPLFSYQTLTEDEWTLFARCKPLVLLWILRMDEDHRVRPDDRLYLKNKGLQLMDSVKSLTEAEDRMIRENASALRRELQQADTELNYGLPKFHGNLRGSYLELIRRMRGALHTYH